MLTVILLFTALITTLGELLDYFRKQPWHYMPYPYRFGFGIILIVKFCSTLLIVCIVALLCNLTMHVIKYDNLIYTYSQVILSTFFGGAIVGIIYDLTYDWCYKHGDMARTIYILHGSKAECIPPHSTTNPNNSRRRWRHSFIAERYKNLLKINVPPSWKYRQRVKLNQNVR